jgi:hypothetical protein
MTLLTHTTDLDLPAAMVADTFFDWTRDRAWRPGVRRMTVHPAGPAVEGQRIVEELRFLGSTYVTPTRIDATHPQRVLWSGGSAQLTIRGWRDLEPTGPGSCRVTSVVDVRLLGPLAWLTPLMAPLYARVARRDLGRLRQAVQASRSAVAQS